jgi:hypothetical protein
MGVDGLFIAYFIFSSEELPLAHKEENVTSIREYS